VFFDNLSDVQEPARYICERAVSEERSRKERERGERGRTQREQDKDRAYTDRCVAQQVKRIHEKLQGKKEKERKSSSSSFQPSNSGCNLSTSERATDALLSSLESSYDHRAAASRPSPSLSPPPAFSRRHHSSTTHRAHCDHGVATSLRPAINWSV
jgi:hypothetical protein